MGCLAQPLRPRSATSQTEQEHPATFTCEHAGIGVGHLSLTGECLRFNGMLCQITGYAREQLLGRPLRAITLPEDADLDSEQLKKLLEGKISRYTTEKRFLQPAGNHVWARLTFSLARQADGTPDYQIVVVEDISPQKEATALRATLAAIVQNSADAILSEGLDGAITSWNRGAERVFGYTAEEVMGRQVFMLAPREDAGDIGRIFEQVRSGEPVQRMEAIRIRKGGQRISVALSVSPIRDAAGKIIGVAKIARDITEHKKAERALQETRRELAVANALLQQQVQERTARLRETVTELEQMSYSIMHDMRAPLRAITAYSEMVELDLAQRLTSQSREYLARMQVAAARMDELICDVLNYSRIVRQGLDLHPVNLVQLLRGIIATYPAFQGPKVRIDLPLDLPLVQGNEAALTQCFSNLLDNAVKFVRPGGLPAIRIEGEIRCGRARIFVTDNGIGVPEDLHERIFGIFERGSTAYEGTGMGLAIVRKAAERMGGTVGIQSRPGQQGSRFWLDLPLAVADPS